jgi:hypothetical protein
VSALLRWLALPGLLLLAACETPPPLPHTALVRAELAQLVADEQPPCGAVREYTRHGRLHYRVECESGRVYRVQVSGDGRVTVKHYAP